MAVRAQRTDPALWEAVKREVTRGEKGGHADQWSARKAQLAVQEYKKRGGGYEGKRSPDNHLLQWEREDWGTKSGRKSTETGERYLPRKARGRLSDAEYARTTAKKRRDAKAGRQFSAQPGDVARKTAPYRATTEAKRGGGSLATLTRTALMDKAREQGLPGRSRMRKDALVEALSRKGA